MEYLFVSWKHNFLDEPIEFYMELDDRRNQLRVVEIYEDDHVTFATKQVENGAFLAKEEYPTLEEVNLTEEFRAKLITKDEFEKIWCEKTNYQKL